MEGNIKHLHKGNMVSGYIRTSALKVSVSTSEEYEKRLLGRHDSEKMFRNVSLVRYELCENKP